MDIDSDFNEKPMKKAFPPNIINSSNLFYDISVHSNTRDNEHKNTKIVIDLREGGEL